MEGLYGTMICFGEVYFVPYLASFSGKVISNSVFSQNGASSNKWLHDVIVTWDFNLQIFFYIMSTSNNEIGGNSVMQFSVIQVNTVRSASLEEIQLCSLVLYKLTLCSASLEEIQLCSLVLYKLTLCAQHLCWRPALSNTQRSLLAVWSCVPCVRGCVCLLRQRPATSVSSLAVIQDFGYDP
jgi:hypothetical protein